LTAREVAEIVLAPTRVILEHPINGEKTRTILRLVSPRHVFEEVKKGAWADKWHLELSENFKLVKFNFYCLEVTRIGLQRLKNAPIVNKHLKEGGKNIRYIIERLQAWADGENVGGEEKKGAKKKDEKEDKESVVENIVIDPLGDSLKTRLNKLWKEKASNLDIVSIFHSAIVCGDADLIKEIIADESKAGNRQSSESIVNRKGEDGWTPLMRASYRGQVEIYNELLKNGANTTVSKN